MGGTAFQAVGRRGIGAGRSARKDREEEMGETERGRAPSPVLDPAPVELTTSAHLALAEEEPIDRDALLQRQGDEEIRVGGRAALVAVHVLLEHAEIPR